MIVSFFLESSECYLLLGGRPIFLMVFCSHALADWRCCAASCMHVLSFSVTHSNSLLLELSRAYTLARAHLLAGECLFLLAAQASASIVFYFGCQASVFCCLQAGESF